VLSTRVSSVAGDGFRVLRNTKGVEEHHIFDEGMMYL
jgi:hypothetical protein